MIFYKGIIIKQCYTKNNYPFCQVKYSKDFFSNYTKHSHDMLNITGVVKGKLLIEFANKQNIILEKNIISIINKDEVHRSKSLSKNSYGYYVLYIDNTWLKQVLPFNINIIDNDMRYKKINFFNTKIIFFLL